MPRLPRQQARAERPEAPRDLEVARGQADRVRRGPASNSPMGKAKEKEKRAKAKEKEKEKVRRAKAKEAKGKARARKVRARMRIKRVGYGTQTFSVNI